MFVVMAGGPSAGACSLSPVVGGGVLVALREMLFAPVVGLFYRGVHAVRVLLPAVGGAC